MQQQQQQHHQNKTIHGDSAQELKKLGSNTIDAIITDPPYGYSFVGKDWDKAVIGVEIWKECLRILKPGAFAFVMSAPRQDVMARMIVNLTDAGFVMSFTPLFWAYATGFIKAKDIAKQVDKKMGVKPIKTKQKPFTSQSFTKIPLFKPKVAKEYLSHQMYDTKPNSDEAKKVHGAYAGYQPKPAVEAVLVCMKPLEEKNYTEQAMANRKGVTWLNDCRMPIADYDEYTNNNDKGRYPSNLVISDNILNTEKNKTFCRYFDLDLWLQKQFETKFIITPKPSVSEKNKGLDIYNKPKLNPDFVKQIEDQTGEINSHPTVKPIALISYLVKLGTRVNDIVLDPFMGSGTTAIACEMTARKWLGVEREQEYIEIINGRLRDLVKQQKLEDVM